MKTGEMVAALEAYLGQGASGGEETQASFKLPDANWLVALCSEQETAPEYLMAFEAAMQRLLDAGSEAARLGLAVDFGAVARQERPSYRQALKKYSSSIVFEDVGITLFLVLPNEVRQLSPTEINPFLRELDAFVRRA